MTGMEKKITKMSSDPVIILSPTPNGFTSRKKGAMDEIDYHV
jgi:hypothetical protein